MLREVTCEGLLEWDILLGFKVLNLFWRLCVFLFPFFVNKGFSWETGILTEVKEGEKTQTRGKKTFERMLNFLRTPLAARPIPRLGYTHSVAELHLY